jgi:membrane protein YdbS with pleckstrin-like domain
MRSLLPISLVLLIAAAIAVLVTRFDPPPWVWFAIPVLLLLIAGATIDRVRANRWMERQLAASRCDAEDR